MPKIIRIIFSFAAVLSFEYSADAKHVKKLNFPDRKNSLETLHSSIRGIYVNKDSIYLIPEKKNYIIKTPFKSDGKNRDKIFGSFKDSKRIQIDPKQSKGPWNGIIGHEKNYLLLDGRNMALSLMNSDYQIDISRDVIFDRPLPAADSRGEAPRHEINAKRSRFLKNLRLAPSIRILGMGRMPKKWFKSPKPRYLAFTSVKGFPLIRMVCEIDDPANCKIDRLCNLEGAKDLKPVDLAGMSFNPKTKEIFVGDRERKIIRIFKYNSCYHSYSRGKIELPEKLKLMGGLFVDSSERLWVSTLVRDDYHNASLYYWEKGNW